MQKLLYLLYFVTSMLKTKQKSISCPKLSTWWGDPNLNLSPCPPVLREGGVWREEKPNLEQQGGNSPGWWQFQTPTLANNP